MKRIVWEDTFFMESKEIDMWLDEIKYDYDCGENEAYGIMQETNAEYLEDERINLDIQLPGEIVVLAELGLWDGRKYACKTIRSGNVKDCLYSGCDFNQWYCDRYNFKCNAVHHDGTNHYTYRVFRNDVTEEQKDRFYAALYKGECNDRMIRRYTESVRPYIAKVYGW